MSVRLLVTGTREGWSDVEALERILREHFEALCQQFNTHVVTLVHGAALGVDRQARDIWISHGLPVEPHPANWALYGKAAGPRRNSEMVALGAQQCVAFVHPDSRGTLDCMAKARDAGIPVHSYYEP